LATRFGLLTVLGLLSLPRRLATLWRWSRLGCASCRLATASAVAISWLGTALCLPLAATAVLLALATTATGLALATTTAIRLALATTLASTVPASAVPAITPGLAPRPPLPLSTFRWANECRRRDNDYRCDDERFGTHPLCSSNTVARLNRRFWPEHGAIFIAIRPVSSPLPAS